MNLLQPDSSSSYRALHAIHNDGSGGTDMCQSDKDFTGCEEHELSCTALPDSVSHPLFVWGASITSSAVDRNDSKPMSPLYELDAFQVYRMPGTTPATAQHWLKTGENAAEECEIGPTGAVNQSGIPIDITSLLGQQVIPIGDRFD